MLRRGKKKRRIIIYIVYTFFFLDFRVQQNIEFEVRKVKYFNYTNLEITSAKNPADTHLFFETSAGILYLVDSGDRTKFYKSIDKGDNLTQVDVDPDNSSGDNKSRDFGTFIAWHDRTNTIIYLVDLDTVGDDLYMWKIDYPTDTVTDLGSISKTDIIPHDIFIIGSDLFVFAYHKNGAQDQFEIFKWVDPNWVSQDTQNLANLYFGNLGVVIGNLFYFRGEDAANDETYMYSYTHATTTIAQLLDVGNFDNPDETSQGGMTYDGNNLISFIVKDGADHKLVTYNISGNSASLGGIYNIALMLDRNTASGVQEKAFHLTNYEVYQIKEGSTQLYLIAVPDTGEVIIAITDNFFMTTTGKMYEYEDQIGLISSLVNDHEVGEASQGIIALIKGSIPIAKNMLLKIFHNYTTGDPPILYKGTYNFKDEADGTSGTDIDFVDSATTGVNTTLQIIPFHNGHRKVLEFYDNDAGARVTARNNFADQEFGTVELFFEGSDVAKLFDIRLSHGSTEGPFLFIGTDFLRYFDGGFHNIVAVVDSTIYRLRIDFECGAGGYEGLATDTFYVYLNDTRYGPFPFDTGVDHIDNFYFQTNTGQSGYYYYLDAIGYSWDIDYTVGDNKKVEAEEKLIFEGVVTNFTEDPMQTVTLVSPAKKEVKTILPEGSFTKDSDGLISQLIIDYNNYVTGGTLSDGGDLGTIALGGVLTEETIFDGCAKFDGFEWYFNPAGQLLYNNGTVDSTVDYSQADVLSGVNISHVHEEYNRIKVRGAYVDGVQIESVWQEDLESQQRLGINERIFLISFLNTVALCNTAAANILTILAKDPLRVKFTIKDAIQGYIQVGETITFEYAASGKIVASDQFIITSATINKYGDIRYTIVSELS